jgi:hypothetical protein
MTNLAKLSLWLQVWCLEFCLLVADLNFQKNLLAQGLTLRPVARRRCAPPTSLRRNFGRQGQN